MLLRTYPLIVHPAFIAHVEKSFDDPRQLGFLPTPDIPEHLPRLRSTADISRYLKVTPFMVRSMMSRKGHHYRQFAVTKRSGGTRIISAPRTFLKVVQWWVLDSILSKATVPSYVHGFVRGRSFISNASSHVGAKYVVNVDISDFFPSIKLDQVRRVFQSFGYGPRVSTDLGELTTLLGSLPQGAPTSPMIANLVFSEIDLKISAYCEMLGLHYTRYADDLTFSSQSRIPVSFLHEVELILAVSNFKLNPAKTRFMGRNQQKEVTGLIVTEQGVRLSRETLNGLRGWFHNAYKNPVLQQKNYEKILGSLNLVKQVGGAGTVRLIELGDAALQSIERARSSSPGVS